MNLQRNNDFTNYKENLIKNSLNKSLIIPMKFYFYLLFRNRFIIFIETRFKYLI